ncbi:MAG TPA: lytic transglycosylase domain-containing protein [Steroidobacteraceae bacterium]
MRSLSVTATVLFALFSNSLSAADRPVLCDTERWQPIIAEAVSRSGISAHWLQAVIRAESAGCVFMNDRPTTSSAGAMGLMQLMPTTWTQMSQRLKLGDDPYQPHDNILAGAEYLRELYNRYGSPGFIAAYHAGPERYEDAVRGSRPLPAETVDYIARVLRVAGSSADRVTIHATDSGFLGRPFVMRVPQPQSTGSTFNRLPHSTPFVELMHARHPPERHVGVQPDVQGQ